MEDAKSIAVVRSAQELDSVAQRELALQGEALEALEKTYGIWQSVKLHKTALVYSSLDPIFDRNICLLGPSVGCIFMRCNIRE